MYNPQRGLSTVNPAGFGQYLFAGLMMLLLLAGNVEAETAVDPRIKKSRAVVGEFGKQLVGELQQALHEGGPVNAIRICNVMAPDISMNLSDKYGWQTGRTSLKPRNPHNAPDAWERQVLQQFEQRKQNGEDIAALEYYEEVEMGGQPVFRYMKAIPTKALCLTCHGTEIADEVRTALEARYPEDQATGFRVGDIRGAFTLTRSK